MMLSSYQERNFFPACALIIAHLVTRFLAAWFHHHPEYDHAESAGGSYHAHAWTFQSYASELAQDHHDSPSGLHLLEGKQLFDELPATIVAYSGQVFTTARFAPIDFFVSPVVENSPPNSVVNSILKLPPIQLARDYFALTATGLSPPLA